ACGGGTVEPTATATTGPAPTATATSDTGVTAAPTATPTSAPAPVVTETPKRGGILRQSRSEDPPNWDSQANASSADSVLGAKFMSQLVWNPRGQEIAPDAAEEYSISADGKVWTFKLRSNVKFHSYTPPHPRDGTTMTSTDVKWSLEKMMGMHGQILSPRCGWIKEFIDIDRPDNGIEIVDQLTLRVHMHTPFSGLANTLALGFCGILPEGVTTPDTVGRPFGSGPFRMVQISPGAHIRFERNNDYYKPGLPYLDGWHFNYMEGTTITQAAFATNRLDLGTGDPLPANRDLWDKLIAEGKIYTQDISAQRWTIQGVFMNMYKPPFNDKRLREIVNLGMDRQGYAAVRWDDAPRVMPTLLVVSPWGRSEEEVLRMPGWRQPHDTDFAEAQRRLKELYPAGLDITLLARNSTGYMKQAEYVAGDLSNIGFNVTIRPQDTATYFGRMTNLDYTISAYHFVMTTMTLEENLAYYITGGSRNWFGISDPRVDSGYLEVAAISDPVKRKQKAQELEDILMDHLFGVPLGSHGETRAAWSYVRGYEVGITHYAWRKKELVWRSDV
ncbi:MAG: hypothetical protein HY532_03575, partial [Chloroflexi bacterium]|nr:hypothetical protein [Chloroflexota bacterium]